MALAKDAQATRDRLVAAARAAFSRQGFERTTVREIAAAAGVVAARPRTVEDEWERRHGSW